MTVTRRQRQLISRHAMRPLETSLTHDASKRRFDGTRPSTPHDRTRGGMCHVELGVVGMHMVVARLRGAWNTRTLKSSTGGS